jgi:hypothetical protein
MTRYATSVVLRTVATTFLLASALVTVGALPATATVTASGGTTTCPPGPVAVTDVGYVVFHADGTSDDVSTLQGNVRLGDTVNALFNVPALPAGCTQVELSLASYSSNRPASHKQSLFSSDTGEFLPGGRYEMSVTVSPAPSAGAPRVYFRLAFATGPVLASPRYGQDLIASAKN